MEYPTPEDMVSEICTGLKIERKDLVRTVRNLAKKTDDSYQEAVKNVAQYIRENGPASPDCAFDAFCASSVLSVAFEKD